MDTSDFRILTPSKGKKAVRPRNSAHLILRVKRDRVNLKVSMG